MAAEREPQLERRSGKDASALRLATPRLVLTMPAPSEAESVLEYFWRNRDHLEPWEPPRPPDFYTVSFWRRRLGHNRSDCAADRSVRLFLRPREDPGGPVLGTCSFNNIVRGVFQACHLGYGLDAGRQGQGLMFEALQTALGYAFDELRLHRVMANYRPSNRRSARLLRRLGFEIEGYARHYLYIDGSWRDHVLTSRLHPVLGPPDRT